MLIQFTIGQKWIIYLYHIRTYNKSEWLIYLAYKQRCHLWADWLQKSIHSSELYITKGQVKHWLDFSHQLTTLGYNHMLWSCSICKKKTNPFISPKSRLNFFLFISKDLESFKYNLFTIYFSSVHFVVDDMLSPLSFTKKNRWQYLTQQFFHPLVSCS